MIKNFKIFVKILTFLCQIFQKVSRKFETLTTFQDNCGNTSAFWHPHPHPFERGCGCEVLMRISADADVRYITTHYIFPSTLEIHTQSTMTHRDWIKGERCMGPLKTDHSNLDASRFDAKLMNLCPTISWGRYVCQSMRMNITSKLVMGRIWLLRIRGFRFYARMHSKRSNWREAKIIVIRSKI